MKISINLKAVLLVVVVILLMGQLYSQDNSGKLRDSGSDDWPIGFPSAEYGAKNVVPMDEISQIGLFEAGRTWGHVSPLTEIPCVDQDGNIVAFYVVFKIHRDQKTAEHFEGKSYRAIVDEIRQARLAYPGVSAALQKARRGMDQRISKAERKTGSSLPRYRDRDGEEMPHPEVMSIPPTPEYREAYARMEENRKRRTGEEEYGTVLVSARADLIPVPVVIHGLPTFYTRGDMLQAKAGEIIGGSPELIRIYMGGPLDQWYEFLNKEGKSVLVDPFKGTTYSSNEIFDLMPDELRMKADPETVDRKWKSLLQDSRREQ